MAYDDLRKADGRAERLEAAVWRERGVMGLLAPNSGLWKLLSIAKYDQHLFKKARLGRTADTGGLTSDAFATLPNPIRVSGSVKKFPVSPANQEFTS